MFKRPNAQCLKIPKISHLNYAQFLKITKNISLKSCTVFENQEKMSHLNRAQCLKITKNVFLELSTVFENHENVSLESCTAVENHQKCLNRNEFSHNIEKNETF